MAEYIKREEAIKALIRHVSALTDEEIEYTLNKIPAADVVEVVRCKDCKFVSKDEPFMWCNGNRVNPDDFCSYGERREP